MMEDKRLFSTGTSPLLLISQSQLLEVITAALRRVQQEKQEQELEEKLMSPVNTCQLFHPPISLVTLNKWSKKGLLTKYYIGGRTYYKYKEVIKSLQALKRYKKY